MNVPIFIAEERNYGPDQRVGSAIRPSRVRYSFAPIPKSERVISYREGRATFDRTIRVTGGDEPSVTVRAAGELMPCHSIEAGREAEVLFHLFQFPTGLCVRAEDLLRMARAGERGCSVAPAIRKPPAPRPAPPAPIGPAVPAVQAGFAW